AALGGYVARCENADCRHTVIAYRSCRNRHCPKCQGSQALVWMEDRKAELLQVPYFHIVFTLPTEIAAIAYQNKASIYALLFKAASETMLTIAGDPKHLGAKVGITAVLHTWGSAMTHHPHVHMIVTGGGVSPDGSRWIGSRPDYLVPVEVLSSLFRGRMLAMLINAHHAGRLQFFGNYKHLAAKGAFKAYLGPLWKTDWFVYAKRPFAGPEQVLAYLSRYTHRVAISDPKRENVITVTAYNGRNLLATRPFRIQVSKGDIIAPNERRSRLQIVAIGVNTYAGDRLQPPQLAVADVGELAAHPKLLAHGRRSH